MGACSETIYFVIENLNVQSKLIGGDERGSVFLSSGQGFIEYAAGWTCYVTKTHLFFEKTNQSFIKFDT